MGDPDWTLLGNLHLHRPTQNVIRTIPRNTNGPFLSRLLSAHFRPSAAWCFHGGSGQFAVDAGGPPPWLGQREI